MEFVSLLKPASAQPKSQWLETMKRASGQLSIVKDQLTITSWLALGGCLNVTLFFAIGRLALLFPFLLILFRFTDAFLMAYGLKKNPYMDGVILNKFSAQIPDERGRYGPKPANRQVVVFLIGAKCNHPLGLLGPGFKELSDFFDKMHKHCEKNAKKYGFLGSSSWTAAGERDTGNELMTVMYFKNSEGLHQFAHEPIHREGWNWWNKTIEKHSHISIWHELYVAPAGHWESIYVNTKPTLLAASTVPVKDDSGTRWFSTVVDARTGPLKSSKGRMTLSEGNDNDKYDDDPYENYVKS